MAVLAEVVDHPGRRVPSRVACARLDPTDDATLIDATRAGDLAAYGELYGRHVDACRRLARRLCRSRHAADDVVSDVFVNTLNAIRNGHGPIDEFAPYVLRSIRHQAGRAHTRGDGRRTDSVDPATFDITPTTEVAGTDDQMIMTQAFGRLPERFRQVLWEAEVEGRSHAEIGARLGLREPAVAALARRARNAFCRAYLDVRANRSGGTRECTEIRSLLASHVRGSVGERNRNRIDAHLASCAECDGIRADMERLDVSLRSVLWPASGAGLVGVSRWAVLFERASFLANIGDLSKLVATAAVGLTLVVAPSAPDELGTPSSVVAEHPDHDRAAIATLSAAAAGHAVTVTPPAPAEPPAVDAARSRPPATPTVAPPVVGPALEDDRATPTAPLPAAGADGDADGLEAPDLDGHLGTSIGPIHGENAPAAPSIDVEPIDALPAEPVLEVELIGDGVISVGPLGDDLLSVGIGGDPVLDVGLAGDDLLSVEVSGGDLASASVAGDDGLVSADVADGAVSANVLGPDAVASVGVGDAANIDLLAPGQLVDGNVLGIELGGLFGS